MVTCTDCGDDIGLLGEVRVGILCCKEEASGEDCHDGSGYGAEGDIGLRQVVSTNLNLFPD